MSSLPSQSPEPEQDWWPWTLSYLPVDRIRAERFEGGGHGRGFQRKLYQRFVTRQTAAFSEAVFAPVRVVEVIGDEGEVYFSPVDGSHSVEIAAAKGYEYIPCLVHRDRLTYEERARLFTDINEQRRNLTAAENFRGRFEHNSDMAHGLIALLSDHNFYLSGYKPVDGNGLKRLEALGPIVKLYNIDGAALDKALWVFEAWQSYPTRNVETVTLQALCRLARHENFDPTRMRAILKARGPHRMFEAALANPGQRRPTVTSMELALTAEYNKRLSKKNRLDDV